MPDDKNRPVNQAPGPVNSTTNNPFLERLQEYQGRGPSQAELRMIDRYQLWKDKFRARKEDTIGVGEGRVRQELDARAQDAQDRMQHYAGRIKSERELTKSAAMMQLISSAGQLGKPKTIASAVNTLQQQPDVIRDATGYNGMSWEEHATAKTEARAKTTRIHKSLMNTLQQGIPAELEDDPVRAQEWFDKQKRKEIKLGFRMQHSMSNEAALGVAGRRLRDRGLDAVGEERMFQGAQDKAANFLNDQQIREDIARGRIAAATGRSDLRSYGDVQAAHTSQSQQILSKTAQLQAGQVPTKELKDFKAALRGLINDTDRLGKVMREMKAGGTVGQKIAAGASFAGRMANVAEDVAIWQPLQRRGLQAEFANLGNQQFGMFKKAIGGDQASMDLLRVMGQVKGRGDVMTSRMNTVAWANAGVGATMTAADVAATGSENALFGGKVGTAILKGGVGTAEVGGRLLGDLQVKAHRAGLQGITNEIALAKAIQAIPAEYKQEVYNMHTGAINSLTGIGGARREQMYGQLTGLQAGGIREQLSDIGVGVARQNQITAAGVAAVGTQFQTSDIVQMRQMERRGYGTMEQNLQRRAQLQMVGLGKQDDLKDVMTSAVSSGLDSSKAISMVVEATAQSAQNLSDVGIEVGKETASMLSLGAAGQGEVGIRRAATALAVANARTSDTDMNFINVRERMQLSALSGGTLDNVALTGFQGMNLTQRMRAVRGWEKGGKAKEDVLRQLADIGITNEEAEKILGTKEGRDTIMQSALTKTFFGKGAKFDLIGTQYEDEIRSVWGKDLKTKEQLEGAVGKTAATKILGIGRQSGFDTEKMLKLLSTGEGVNEIDPTKGKVNDAIKAQEATDKMQMQMLKEGDLLFKSMKQWQEEVTKLATNSDAIRAFTDIGQTMAKEFAVLNAAGGALEKAGVDLQAAAAQLKGVPHSKQEEAVEAAKDGHDRAMGALGQGMLQRGGAAQNSTKQGKGRRGSKRTITGYPET